MSVTTRLVAFVVGLGVVFALSFGAGRAVGPDPDTDHGPTTDHSGTDHEETSE